MEIIIDKSRERWLSRALNRQGLALRKSRRRTNFDYLNEGGYMIVNPYINGCVAGPRFELSLDDVQDYLDEWAEE